MARRSTRKASQSAEELNSRDKILREATRLFAQYGYEGTSLRMIGEATDLQKGSLVYHFETKDQIHEAVLEGVMQRWQEVLPQIVLTASTGKNRFERTVTECTRFFRQDPDRARFLLRECLDHPKQLQERISAALLPWLSLLAERIRQGQSEGIIRPDVDPPVYVWGVVLQTITVFSVLPMAEAIVGGRGLEARTEAEVIRMARSSLFLPAYEEGDL